MSSRRDGAPLEWVVEYPEQQLQLWYDSANYETG